MEEDIKILENFTEQTVLYGGTVGMTLEKYKDLQLSIKHILSDYKRVLKENEELKKFHIQDNKHLDFIMKNSITVQKIKDKIEYLDKQQNQWLEDRELKASDSEIIFARNFLQELLKESEKKMNEEEKKAVEFIRDLITWDVRQYLCPNKEECKNLEIILNLIEKQQKEIDELQSYIKEYLIPKSTINLLYVSKDKIREKIKEYDDFYKEYPIEFRKYKMRPITVVLKELLEEE